MKTIPDQGEREVQVLGKTGRIIGKVIGKGAEIGRIIMIEEEKRGVRIGGKEIMRIGGKETMRIGRRGREIERGNRS